MNPIIFIDELDKISKTDNGKELIGILTHLTDKTQNNEFMDKYFSGVKIDLSKVLFIFSYNDYNLLDKILADRIHRIQFDNYTIYDKIIICRDYLIPRVEKVINIIDYNIYFSDDIIKYIINSYTNEPGVRKLNERLYDIYRDINLKIIEEYNLPLTDDNLSIIVNEKFIDNILGTHQKIRYVSPFDEPRIGVVYGLYATTSGNGGITIIQASEQKLDGRGVLLLTGKQGDIMKESMNVSLTCALSKCSYEALSKYDLTNLDVLDDDLNNDDLNNDDRDNIDNLEANINDDIEDNIDNLEDDNIKEEKNIKKKKLSLHIHCPDGATPKDGPSAGCAITIAIISVIENKPISNKYTMTGEIDILGNVLPIGGLSSKIMGSKNSGIYNVIVPKKNKKDVSKIKRNSPGIIENMNIIYVQSIDEVINLVF